MKKVAIKVAFSLLFLLVLVEGVARIAFDAPVYYTNLVDDPVAGFRMRGSNLRNEDDLGTFRYITNSQGFRGPELPTAPRPKDDDTYRVLMIGDSFLNAWAVRPEFLMSEGVKRALEAEGRPTEVFVCSCDGYGTAQELLQYERYVDTLRPDAVVLVIYPPNDVLNNSIDHAGLSWGDFLRPFFVVDDEGKLTTTYSHPWRRRLRRFSRAFALGEFAIMKSYRDESTDWGALREPTRPTPELLKEGRTPVDLWMPLCRKPDAKVERAWRTTEAIIDTLNKDVARRGADFLTLVVPHVAQVCRNIFEEDMQFQAALINTTLEDVVDWNGPEKRLHAFGERRQIDVRSLVDVLREHTGPDQPRMYVEDGHLSRHAHPLAAKMIVDWIQGRDAPAGRTAEGAPQWVIEPPTGSFHESLSTEQSHLIRGGHGFDEDGVIPARYITFAVVARHGDLHYRIVLPEGAPLPCTVEIGIQSLHAERVRLEKHGVTSGVIQRAAAKEIAAIDRVSTMVVYMKTLTPWTENGQSRGPTVASIGIKPRTGPAPQGRGSIDELEVRNGTPARATGSGAPPNTRGWLVIADPQEPFRHGDGPPITVDLAHAHAVVPLETDGRGHWSVEAPPGFKPKSMPPKVAVQVAFSDPDTGRILVGHSRLLQLRP